MKKKQNRTAAVLATYFDLFYGPPMEDEEDEDGGQGFSAIGVLTSYLDRWTLPAMDGVFTALTFLSPSPSNTGPEVHRDQQSKVRKREGNE